MKRLESTHLMLKKRREMNINLNNGTKELAENKSNRIGYKVFGFPFISFKDVNTSLR